MAEGADISHPATRETAQGTSERTRWYKKNNVEQEPVWSRKVNDDEV